MPKILNQVLNSVANGFSAIGRGIRNLWQSFTGAIGKAANWFGFYTNNEKRESVSGSQVTRDSNSSTILSNGTEEKSSISRSDSQDKINFDVQNNDDLISINQMNEEKSNEFEDLDLEQLSCKIDKVNYSKIVNYVPTDNDVNAYLNEISNMLDESPAKNLIDGHAGWFKRDLDRFTKVKIGEDIYEKNASTSKEVLLTKLSEFYKQVAERLNSNSNPNPFVYEVRTVENKHIERLTSTLHQTVGGVFTGLVNMGDLHFFKNKKEDSFNILLSADAILKDLNANASTLAKQELNINNNGASLVYDDVYFLVNQDNVAEIKEYLTDKLDNQGFETQEELISFVSNLKTPAIHVKLETTIDFSKLDLEKPGNFSDGGVAMNIFVKKLDPNLIFNITPEFSRKCSTIEAVKDKNNSIKNKDGKERRYLARKGSLSFLHSTDNSQPSETGSDNSLTSRIKRFLGM